VAFRGLVRLPMYTSIEEAEMLDWLKMPFASRQTVEIATNQDIQEGVQDALRGLSLTLPELREQARAGRFSSERARLVWSAIRDVATTD
jgi:hypothetical protein